MKIIGISGGSGSGKTTLANELKELFKNDATIISQDNYYKSQDEIPIIERSETNYDHPNAIDFNLLKEHLLLLKNGLSIIQPVYNFNLHTRSVSKGIKTHPSQYIILEGTLIFNCEKVRQLCDFKFFIDIPEITRIKRRIKRDQTERGRDLESIHNQLKNSVIPMHNLYTEPTKKHANFILTKQTILSVMALKSIFLMINE